MTSNNQQSGTRHLSISRSGKFQDLKTILAELESKGAAGGGHNEDGPLPFEIMERTHMLCKKFLGGSWKDVPVQDLLLTRMKGGMSNILFLCRLPPEYPPRKGEPDKTLLRVYFNPETESHLVAESVIFTLLSERKLGPRLYGIFNGGRLEEYIVSRPLSCKEIREPHLSIQIAEKLARVHQLNVPIEKEPDYLCDALERWNHHLCEVTNDHPKAISVKLASGEEITIDEDKILTEISVIRFLFQVIQKRGYDKSSIDMSCYQSDEDTFSSAHCDSSDVNPAAITNPQLLSKSNPTNNLLINPSDHNSSSVTNNNLETKTPVLISVPDMVMTNGYVEDMYSTRSNDDLPTSEWPIPKVLTMDQLMDEFHLIKKCIARSHSPILFCHNDLQEGNILLPKGTDPSAAMNGSENADEQSDHLVFIDFEYASYNYRGSDFANHFVEWMLDYNNAKSPYFTITEANFPGEEAQRSFFAAYLEAEKELEKSLGVPLKGSFPDKEDTPESLMEETKPFVAVSHFFWGVWALLQLEVSPVEFGFQQYGKERLRLYFENKEAMVCLLAQAPPPRSPAISRSASRTPGQIQLLNQQLSSLLLNP